MVGVKGVKNGLHLVFLSKISILPITSSTTFIHLPFADASPTLSVRRASYTNSGPRYDLIGIYDSKANHQKTTYTRNVSSRRYVNDRLMIGWYSNVTYPPIPTEITFLSDFPVHPFNSPERTRAEKLRIYRGAVSGKYKPLK